MTTEQEAFIIIVPIIAIILAPLLFWYATQHYWRNRNRIKQLEKQLHGDKKKGKYASLRKRRATQADIDAIAEIVDLKAKMFEPPPEDFSNVPATDRQLAYIKVLGGRPRRTMTFQEASNEIDRLKGKR